MSRFFQIYVCILVLCQFALAQEKKHPQNGNFGIEYGLWKPSTLDSNPSRPLKNVQGADNYFGISVISPTLKGYALRLTIFQWKQSNLQDRSEFESVTLRHLALDLMNPLIIHSPIVPYVSYGAAIVWSRESINGSTEKQPLDRAGYGANLGAGIEFLMFSKLALAIEYQYLYAMFANEVGLAQNYSGPKLSAKLLYHF